MCGIYYFLMFGKVGSCVEVWGNQFYLATDLEYPLGLIERRVGFGIESVFPSQREIDPATRKFSKCLAAGIWTST